jgi:hypothetical protein
VKGAKPRARPTAELDVPRIAMALLKVQERWKPSGGVALPAAMRLRQQYRPDELADRRYYLPTEQGYEATIGNRMEARGEKRATGKPKRSTAPKPEVKHGAGAQILQTREANRKKLAETEKKDAAG